MRPEDDELGAARESGWSIPEVMAEAYAQQPIHASLAGCQNRHLPNNLPRQNKHLPLVHRNDMKTLHAVDPIDCRPVANSFHGMSLVSSA
jgi:hypothetical protein